MFATGLLLAAESESMFAPQRKFTRQNRALHLEILRLPGVDLL